jgi:hypothetical protein
MAVVPLTLVTDPMNRAFPLAFNRRLGAAWGA